MSNIRTVSPQSETGTPEKWLNGGGEDGGSLEEGKEGEGEGVGKGRRGGGRDGEGKQSGIM